MRAPAIAVRQKFEVLRGERHPRRLGAFLPTSLANIVRRDVELDGHDSARPARRRRPRRFAGQDRDAVELDEFSRQHFAEHGTHAGGILEHIPRFEEQYRALEDGLADEHLGEFVRLGARCRGPAIEFDREERGTSVGGELSRHGRLA